MAGFVCSFFEAIQHGERNEIVDGLTAPGFAPDALDRGAYIGEIPLLARTAQIISRASQWKYRLARLQKRIDAGEGRDIEGLLRCVPRLEEACAALMRDIEDLDELAATLPARATVHEYAEATDRLLDLLGMPDAAARIDAPLLAPTEHAACAASRRLPPPP